MGWVFALTTLTNLGNIVRAILHPRSRTLQQNILVGPMFYSAMTVMPGIALWAIWKDKSWARGLAVTASSIYILYFLRQFIVPVRAAWDHHVGALLVGTIGAVAFLWRDKQVDVFRSDHPKSR
jgi:uncharacterized membrane protein (DUF2068 family)